SAYSHARHRYLDAVPTRRSSDLSPEEPDGAELVLEPNDNPAARAYQQALYEQNIPAAAFHTDNLQRDYDRLTGLGVRFTVPLTTDRKSTRLNSSHVKISYAVFCL